MALTTEEFITEFHSLTGITIGERRKNLFLLLNRIDRTKSNFNFSQLIPETPLEEKFKVETLIYFKRIPELLEVLNSENPILIKKVLNVAWFLQEAFENITGEQLVAEIFPYISFNTKLKLLNKLGLYLKNSGKADDYFEAVDGKYGFYLASKLLPGCSPKIIIKCMKFKRIKLTARQLLTIIKNNAEIIEPILKIILEKYGCMEEYNILFLFLANHDLELYCKLYEEYKFGFHLGWRKTSELIQLKREDVIGNPNKYYQLLHNKQIAKSLNQDFKILYRNLFPESLNQLYSIDEFVTIISQLPIKMRQVNLLFRTFVEVYGSQLWDHEDYRDLRLIEMLPIGERVIITQLEYKPPHTSEEEWYCYMKTEKSIPYLKKTISLTSDISTRVHLIRLLIKTCYLNEDKVALLNTCKYMLTKHRNDHFSVRRAFLISLQEKFDLSDLSEEYWSIIHELLDIFTLNQESFDHASGFLEGYIHFCLKNNLPIKEHLIEWLKVHINNSLNIIRKEPNYEKHCIIMFGELISEMFKNKEEGRTGTREEKEIVYFTQCLLDWNRRHSEDRISLFSYWFITNKFHNKLEREDDSYTITEIIKSSLQSKTDLEKTNNLLNLYLKKSTGYVDISIIIWLARNQPLTLINNIEDVTRFELETEYYRGDKTFFWKFWRNYSHLGNFPKIREMCLLGFEKNIIENSNSAVVNNSVIGLSFLTSGEEFTKFITPYYPSDLRADAKTDGDRTLYNIQKYITDCLKNLNPTFLALESIFNFCKGDYLKLIQSSLYSICGEVNEDKLIPFLKKLSDRAVSVRKHSMHLTFKTMNKKEIYSVLNKFMETEKNVSLRKFIFKNIFNFFVLNDDDYAWEIVKKTVNALDINDKEAMEILMQKEKIPLDYISRYIVFTWGILNNLPDANGDKEIYKSNLIFFVKPNIINLLPKEFCLNIIEKYFFKTEDALLTSFASDILTFTCRFIICYCDSEKEQEERLKSNFEIVKEFVSRMWGKSNIRENVRHYVGEFLKAFCLEFLNSDSENKEILNKFANLWNSLFEPHQAFTEYLHLQFTLIYVEKLTVSEIALKVGKLFNSLVIRYGFSICSMFAKEMSSFGYYFIPGEENWYLVIEHFITEGTDYCLVLAILILNDHKPSIPITEAKYQTFIETLEKNSDPVIQLYLENHFRNC